MAYFRYRFVLHKHSNDQFSFVALFTCIYLRFHLTNMLVSNLQDGCSMEHIKPTLLCEVHVAQYLVFYVAFCRSV